MLGFNNLYYIKIVLYFVTKSVTTYGTIFVTSINTVLQVKSTVLIVKI